MKKKERVKDFFLPLVPLLHLYPVAFAAVLLGSPVALIFYYMKELGILWVPLICVYWLLLSLAIRKVNLYKEMQEARFIIADDELFFSVYPEYKRMEKRSKRWKALLNKLRGRKAEKN